MRRARQVLCLLLLIIFSEWFYLSLITINLYIDGRDYFTKMDEINLWKKKNMVLREIYLNKTSYTNIATQAEKKEFILTPTIIYLPN